MKRFYSSFFVAATAASLTPQSFAIDDGFYGAISYGVADQSDSANDGRFSTEFTTDSVTGVNPPLTLPADTPVGWNTEFDDGEVVSLAFGMKQGANRYELEFSRNDADVETHTNVEAGGIALGAIDAGVLISGNDGDLGASVAGLVADGQGSLETSSIFLNYYRDFTTNSPLTPFLGVGLGYGDTDVVYQPSAVGIIDDNDSGVAYQIMAGASYGLTDRLDIVGTIRYRDFGDAEVEASLFPATFDIENQSTQLELGLRLGF